MSGYNLPDGVSDGAGTAPWNQPEPWEGRTCGECRHSHACHMSCGIALVCHIPGDDELYEVDARDPACESFEAL